MQERINNILNRPIPLFLAYPQGRNYFKWLMVVLALWVNIYQPFGLTTWNEYHKVLVLSFYCIVYCQSYKYIHIIYNYFNPAFFKPELWTIGKQLQILIMYLPVLACTSLIFAETCIPEFKLSFGLFWRMQYYNTLTLVGIVPLFGTVVSKKLETANTATDEAVIQKEQKDKTMKEDLPRTDRSNENIIRWKESSLDITKILFVECKGNYLYVNYMHNGKLNTINKRFSLKEFESLVTGFPQLIRCHISYMVNMDHVQSWESGTKKLTLYMDFAKLTVTVSETYIPLVKQMLDTNLIPKIKKAKTIPDKKESKPESRKVSQKE
ncbi:MAG: LytTR family DNA-binding domain-containing protein [Paludibacter sp.]